MRFLLAHFFSPLSSLWAAAPTKSPGPSFPPGLCPMGLWQAGPWLGQNEGQLQIFLLDIQDLCCMRSFDSALVRVPKMQHSSSGQYQSQQRCQERNFVPVVIGSSSTALTGLCCLFSSKCQATQCVKNFWLMRGSLTLGQEKKMGKVLCGSLCFLSWRKIWFICTML